MGGKKTRTKKGGAIVREGEIMSFMSFTQKSDQRNSQVAAAP